jgi:hypothetical protein
VGQKVIPRPSADYFVVGRRQKYLVKKENIKGEHTLMTTLDYKEVSALEKTAMAAIDRMKNQHSGKDDMGEFGQQEVPSTGF